MLGADGYQVQGNFAVMALGLVLFAPATYCFVFISGYYGIKFKLKRMITLLLWCMIVSVGAKVYQYVCLGEPFQIIDFMESVLPITSRKWWFMTDFIMLYVLSPILNDGFDRLRQKNKVQLLVLLGIFSFIGVVLLYSNQGSSLIGLLMIYLIGRYIRILNWGGQFGKSRTLKIYLLSFVLLLASLLAIYYVSQVSNKASLAKLIFPFLGYANPLIIAMAVSLFFMVKNLPVYTNRYLNKLLSANLFIYLITEIGVFVSYQQIAEEFSQRLGFALIHSLFVILSCLLAGHIIMFVVALLVENGEKILNVKYKNK